MKIWNQRTHKGRKFCRINRGKMSKDMFYLSYYQLLHTAYLKASEEGKEAVNALFVDLFGHEPNPWSSTYMAKTESCFACDDVTHSLTTDGTIDSKDILRQLLIEIGFDIYLIQTAGSVRRPIRKEFYRWLPIKRGIKQKKLVKRFWKKRLPKEKLLFQLFYRLEPYKKEILSIYRLLLTTNTENYISTTEKDRILAYIESCIGPLEQVTAEKQSEITDDVKPETDTVSEVVSEPAVKAENDVVITEPVRMVEQNTESPSRKNEAVKPAIMPLNQISPKIPVTNIKPIRTTECRGFNEKKKMSRKKAITCAVCVAAAGALLVPLVTYTVIKQKAE